MRKFILCLLITTFSMVVTPTALAKGLFGTIFGGVIGGAIGKITGKSAFEDTHTQQEVDAIITKGFAQIAEQKNRQGPTMIDKDTRWDRSEAGPGPRLTYFYSFPNYSSRDIAPSWLQANLKPDVKKSICANKEMQPSLRYGATYVYAYSGNDGMEIARFQINKNDCN